MWLSCRYKGKDGFNRVCIIVGDMKSDKFVHLSEVFTQLMELRGDNQSFFNIFYVL